MIIERTSNDRFFFTEFVSKFKPAVKEFKSDGTKVFDPRIGTCNYQQRDVTSFEELDSYMHKANHLTTITLGLTYKFNGISKTAEAYRKGTADTYRGQECVKFYNDIFPVEKSKYSILFIDIDFKEDIPDHFKCNTAEDVREVLIKLFPILADIGMLIRPSSSSNVYNCLTEEHRENGQSWHIFIFVANHTKDTNKNFKELLLRRCWRYDVNLAFVSVDDGGSMQNKTLLDMSVLSAERLIAVSKPICQYPYVKQVVPSTIYNGEILDLSKVDPTIEEDYRPKFEAKKRELINLLDFSEFYAVDTDIKTTTKRYGQNISKGFVDTSLPTPNTDKEIVIDEDTQSKILHIYRYFQNRQYPKYQDIKEHFNDQVVAAFLKYLGYEISFDMKFKIRDERTPSCSINYNGWIKDFGSSLSCNVVSFLMELYGLEFIQAWNYIRACFGCKLKLDTKTLAALHDPSGFENCLTINTNNFKDIK